MIRRKEPAITVLMPAYNAAPYIRRAMASILSQTFQDFEFLIIDDGSSDGTAEIVESMDDKRMRLIRNPKNLGLVPTLNLGIDLARGRYIARMDADDISLPRRFEWQYQLMEKSPRVVACSGWSVDVCPGVCNKKNFREADHETLLGRMFVRPPLSHPASFIRRQALLDTGIRYDKRYLHCEDYKLWFDLSKVGKLSNVQAIVLTYQVMETSVSQLHSQIQAKNAKRLRREIIADFFKVRGIPYTVPNHPTIGDIHDFMKLYDLPGIEGINNRRMYVRQLNFLKYCLYMSLQEYSFSSLVRFIASGDFIRYGMRGKMAAKIIIKHIRPDRFEALL